jgi:hypothetical protein
MVTTSRHTDRARTHRPQTNAERKGKEKKKEIFSSSPFTATNQTKGAREEQQNKENKEGRERTKNSKFLSLCRLKTMSLISSLQQLAAQIAQLSKDKKFSGQLAHIPRQLHHLCLTALAIASEEGFNEHELSVFVRRLAAVVKLASSPAQGRDVKA